MTAPFSNTAPALRTPAAVIILTALALLAYANTFNAPFVFDDQPNIVENPHIRMDRPTPESLTRVLKSRSLCRPLSNLSFAVNYYFHGYDVRSYHVFNVVVHIITTLLVWLVTRQTLPLFQSQNELIPFLAAALWLVNPLHTQSVTYIVQRMNSLAAMFVLFSLTCYIRYRRARISGKTGLKPALLLTGAVLAGLCGLISKETTAILPIIIFLYEWYFLQNLDRAWLKKQLGWICLLIITLLVISLIYLKVRSVELLAELYENNNFTPGQRLLTQAGVVIYYISLLFFPHPARLTVNYDFPIATSPTDTASTFLALAALLLLSAAAVYSARKHRLLSFAILWFLATLAIESSFIGLALIFEHRTYLPSVFPFIGLVWLAFSHIRPKALAVAVLCLAISVGGFWTYRRNSVWNSAFTLWQDNLAKTPENAMVYNNFGLACRKLDRIEEALLYYNKTLKKSTPQEEAYNFALCNIGEVLLFLNRPQEALDFFKKAAVTCPEYQTAHLNLGVALQRLGRTDEAMAGYYRVIELNPYMEKAYNNLGNAWFSKGDANRAVDAFNRALAISPFYQEARDNLTKTNNIISKYGGIISQLKKAALQQPENNEAAYQLAQVSQAVGMMDQAVFWYERALALDPGRAVYLNDLGNVYAAAGRIADAAEIFEKLARHIPDEPIVFYNLACLYARQNEKERAVEKLQQALGKGYRNWLNLQTDKDLENIRDTEYYRKLIAGQPER